MYTGGTRGREGPGRPDVPDDPDIPEHPELLGIPDHPGLPDHPAYPEPPGHIHRYWMAGLEILEDGPMKTACQANR